MRRRSKGEGGISVRKDGRLQGTYVGSDGRTKYEYMRKGTPRRLMAERLAEIKREQALGVYVSGPSQTVADYLSRWLERADHLRPITRKRYEQLVRLQVIPHLGSVELRKVQPQHIADLYASLRGKKAPATIGQLHAVLHSAFDQALRWNMIARNPVSAVKAPKVEQREMRVLSLPEIHRFLAVVEGDPLEALYVLAVTTGARQGELLALRWQDVDLDAGTLSIAATLTRMDGEWKRMPPKTKGSVRTLHLTAHGTKALRAHRLRMAEVLLPLRSRTEGEVPVFLNRGDWINGFHLTERSFKPLMKRHGLPEIRFHDLRHGAASLMLSNGVPPHVVAKILGHSSPNVTMKVYAHVIPGDMASAAAVMDHVLEAAG